MRDIRFRAWSKVSREMVDVFSINFSLETITHGIHTVELDDVELMQFTGLLDKNDKEIYEGDIVESYDQSKYQVFYGKDYAAAFTIADPRRHRGAELLGVTDTSDIEVVGNVYENPELITLGKGE